MAMVKREVLLKTRRHIALGGSGGGTGNIVFLRLLVILAPVLALWRGSSKLFISLVD